MKNQEQYCYILKLREHLLNDNNWTDTENKVIEEHFIRLQKDTKTKKIIFAGRTLTNVPEGLG